MALPNDRSTSGISAVAAYAGRIFYAGAGPTTVGGDANSPNISSFIFFTQTLTSKDKINKCYQEADPTSEHISDLIDTDGGFIPIPEANRIFRMIPVKSSLIIFAENGVWQIRGSDAGFSATNLQVTKITNVTNDAPQAVVDAEGTVFFWGKSGIYVLQPDKVTGELEATSISEKTIQTFYKAIPAISRRNTVGDYDPVSRNVRWLYNDSEDYDGVEFKYKFNKELILNTVLGAFHVNTFETEEIIVGPIITQDDAVNTEISVDVVVNGTQVFADSSKVIATFDALSRGSSGIKYFTMYQDNNTGNYAFTFSGYNNTSFKDFNQYDAKTVLETGYDNLVPPDQTENQRNKRVDELSLFFKRTEKGFALNDLEEIVFDNPSSCLVKAKWNWSDSVASGEETDQFQGYKLSRNYIPSNVSDTFDYGSSIITTKNRVRGSGRVLSLRLESEEEKDFHLYGWAYSGSLNNRI